METFEINILGCGSALPTYRHLPSSQIVNVRNNLFLVDCGEGTQLQIRRQQLKFSRIEHIFISHLHGDHCFGLPGLVSTFGLLGRTADLYIHGPENIEAVMQPMLSFFCQHLPYKIVFCPFKTDEATKIYESRAIEIFTIPLNHRIPCCGFLFREKPLKRHILREWTEFYQVPFSWMNRLKNGEDYQSEDGTVIPNSKLTEAADRSRSYAYCSDTAYNKNIIQEIKGVDLLYHEATFCNEDKNRAVETFHSTAEEAAKIAKAAMVKKLLIGHYSARYDDEKTLLKEARGIFPQTILASEGLTIKV